MEQIKYEFIGFLFGEGCFYINRQKPKEYKTQNWTRYIYRPEVKVAVRDDDDAILLWAKKEYGGSLFYVKGRKQIPNQNGSCIWNISSSKSVLRLCNEVLQAKLPSKKIEQVLLLRDLCQMKVERHISGHKGRESLWYTPEEYARQEFVFEELKRMKKYVEKE